MQSNLFKINSRDFIKGAVMAVVTGIFMMLYKLAADSGFDLFHADWVSIWHSAVNVSFVSFIGYIFKNYISDDSGKVLGKI